MLKEKRKRLDVELKEDIIEELEKAYTFRKEQSSGKLSKQDYINDLIHDDFLRVQGKTKDSRFQGEINMFVDDAVGAKFNDLEDLRFSIAKLIKMVDCVVRCTYLTQDVRIFNAIKKAKERGETLNPEEAKRKDMEQLEKMLNEDSEYANAVTEYIENLTNNKNGFFE